MGGHVDGFYAMATLLIASPAPFDATPEEIEEIQHNLSAALCKCSFKTKSGAHRIREANVHLVGPTLTALNRRLGASSRRGSVRPKTGR